jgi:hypothetical protein
MLYERISSLVVWTKINRHIPKNKPPGEPLPTER